jgi:enediyne biosynthesis protein E4
VSGGVAEIVLAWRRFRGVLVTFALLAVIVGMKRLKTTPDRVYEPPPPAAIAAATPFRFHEEAAALGLAYTHRLFYPNPAAKSYLPLMAFPPAIAVADFDDDGFMDVYVVQPEPGQPNRLFRNLGGKSFADVALDVGLADVDKKFAGSMAIWADFDRDGRLDLFQSRFGCHSLFVRDADSLHFTPRSELVAGYCSNPKAVNVADLNRDGWLDLVFGNYYPDTDLASYLPLTHVFGETGANYEGGGSEILYGSGRGFRRANSRGRRAHTTAVGVSDIDSDGWPDLFLSNDYTFDQMLSNQQGRGWKDVTEKTIPLVEHGQSGMNSEFADFDNSGTMSLFVSEMYFPPFSTTKNILWKKQGDAFVNVAEGEGVGRCGWAWTAKFGDFDNSGDLDLFVINGKARGAKVRTRADAVHSFAFVRNTITAVPRSFEEKMSLVPDFSGFYLSGFERDCLFWNKGGHFYDVALESGITDVEEGQAAALIDFDNDGRMDIVVASMGAPLLFYRNLTPSPGHWVGLSLVGPPAMRTPFGAKVLLHREDGKTPMRELYPANGFRGQSDPRVHFGLGQATAVPEVEVRWSDGKVERFKGLRIDAYQPVRYGEGTPE